MKKFFLLLLSINLINVCILNGQNNRPNVPTPREKFEQLMRENEMLKEKLKEVLQTQKRIKEIEREEIEKDPELKNLDIQIKTLKLQLWQKIQERLSTNEEYQRLKRRMNEINEKMKKDIEERMEKMKKDMEEKRKKLEKGGEKI